MSEDSSTTTRPFRNLALSSNNNIVDRSLLQIATELRKTLDERLLHQQHQHQQSKLLRMAAGLDENDTGLANHQGVGATTVATTTAESMMQGSDSQQKSSHGKKLDAFTSNNRNFYASLDPPQPQPQPTSIQEAHCILMLPPGHPGVPLSFPPSSLQLPATVAAPLPETQQQQQHALLVAYPSTALWSQLLSQQQHEQQQHHDNSLLGSLLPSTVPATAALAQPFLLFQQLAVAAAAAANHPSAAAAAAAAAAASELYQYPSSTAASSSASSTLPQSATSPIVPLGVSNASPDTVSHPSSLSRPHSRSSNTPTEFEQQQQASAATDTTNDNNNDNDHQKTAAMEASYARVGMPSSIPSVNRCVPIQVMYPHISWKKLKPTKFVGYVLLLLVGICICHGIYFLSRGGLADVVVAASLR
jgi:hypothetical protein